MFPDGRAVESLCHQVCDLLLGVDVTQTDLRSLAHLEEPVDVDAVSTRQMPESKRPALLDDFDHRFVVFENDQIREVVFGPRIGVVPPWIEVDVVAIGVEIWCARLGLGRRNRGLVLGGHQLDDMFPERRDL